MNDLLPYPAGDCEERMLTKACEPEKVDILKQLKYRKNELDKKVKELDASIATIEANPDVVKVIESLHILRRL